MVTPIQQDPLIYNRFLNHPEFVFPLYFKSKNKGRSEANMTMDMLIAKKVKAQKNASAEQL